MLRSVFNIFRIRRGERRGLLAACVMFIMLNALNVAHYWNLLTPLGLKFHNFVKGWHLSGFDPITYSVISDWCIGYNIYRHPLLPYYMWPLSMLNKGLKAVTGMDWTIVLVALLLVFCATYSFLFLWRIHKDVIGVTSREGYVLTVLTFSMAYVMLATMVPDHFVMSLFWLTLTLYVCGLKLKRGSALNMWQTIVLFFMTAGVSLNNGLKVFLAALVTRKYRFFEWRFLLFAVVLPSALIWGSARLTYKEIVWPKEMARKTKTEQVRKAKAEKLRANVADTIKSRDSVAIEQAFQAAVKKQKEKERRRREMSAVVRHTGKPIAKGEFMRWTDATTSRMDVAVESLFGEGIMIHEEYLLGDVLVNRPVIVHYRNWGNYIVEALLVTLFIIGVWCGRRKQFLWTAMSFLLLDLLLHMVLGFGINEVFIMSAHYLYVLPIAMAYLLKALPWRARRRLAALLAAVAIYLVVWNVTLIVEYLYWG